ncbi:energy transducer TonB [Bdellovibrio sp. ArHS]|uniref:energy transducer TonB n=1 Tax=Bdellovibrio sp. ArHS TaxID=1569284 RepID=UPI000B1FCDC2|nr:energy transducer TonB [Bdellovibrio sp. ArHS]
MRVFLVVAVFSVLIFILARPFAMLSWEDIAEDLPAIPVQVALAPDAQPEPPPALTEDLTPESEQNQDTLTDMGFGSSFEGSGPAVSGLGKNSSGNNGIQQIPAKVLRRVEPEYPAAARSSGLEGLVVLKLRIGPKGELVDTQIIQSEPKGVFERSALEAIQKWSFKPAIQGGTTISAFITQKIRFRLEQ